LASEIVAAGKEFSRTLVESYRRATTASAAVAGTDRVLLECVAQLAPVNPAINSIARSHPILSDREAPSDPGADDPAFGSGSSEFDMEVAATLREAAWVVSGFRHARVLRDDGDVRPRWSRGVRLAVREALSDAQSRGLAVAGVPHLMTSILRHGPHARDLLDRDRGLADQLSEALERGPWLDASARPLAPSIAILGSYGGLRGGPLWLRPLILVARTTTTHSLRGGPVLYVLQQEAVRQCVRLDHRRVAPVHLILAVASLHEQAEAMGERLIRRAARYNAAGKMLADLGGPYRVLVAAAADLGESKAPSSSTNPVPGAQGPGWYPEWTEDAVEATDRSQALARRLGHGQPAPDHLVAALIDPADPAVGVLLQRCGMDANSLARGLRARLEPGA
jgi:hypothetical protein